MILITFNTLIIFLNKSIASSAIIPILLLESQAKEVRSRD
jgi:hypothetical protein